MDGKPDLLNKPDIRRKLSSHFPTLHPLAALSRLQPFATGNNRPRADHEHAANDSVMCAQTVSLCLLMPGPANDPQRDH